MFNIGKKNLKHPKITDWSGVRGWSAPGEPLSSLISYTTDDDIEPSKITHSRDIIYFDGSISQDYNFIDYFFGKHASAVNGRFYLDENEVKISFPDGALICATADAAALQIEPEILLYFKKRFRAISIVTTSGYKTFWKK